MNVSTIGRSSEQRDIKLVTVNGGRGLPKIFIDAGIHARQGEPLQYVLPLHRNILKCIVADILKLYYKVLNGGLAENSNTYILFLTRTAEKLAKTIACQRTIIKVQNL